MTVSAPIMTPFSCLLQHRRPEWVNLASPNGLLVAS